MIISMLGIPLITPLLRWTAVPCTHDGHLHYHRVAAMRTAWENGLYFSRWLPDLAFGYGYPFFVYREPTPLYAALFPHLWGLPITAVSNLFYALCIMAAGWFMFLWVRDLLGIRAGIVSAVAYMSAPYLLVDALIRGNAPESLALPLFPLILWAARRWLLAGSRPFFLISTISLAFLSLSHNISTLLFTPVLLIYLMIIRWGNRMPIKTTILRLGLLFGLGLGMTIFYTGGALLEMDQVTLELSTVTRNNDFHYNFTTLSEIFSPVPSEDPLLVNPPLPFRLGWIPTGLAALGIILSILNLQSPIPRQAQDRFSNLQSPIVKEQRLHIRLMVAGTAVFLFMSLPTSLFVWETVPLIDFAQFPWRFVGRAALPVAFLAGVPFAGKQKTGNRQQKTKNRQRNTQYTIFLTAIALLIIEAVPNLYPNMCKEDGFPTINTVHKYERETGLVGVDPEGSYFPRTVAKRPQSSTLEADYQSGNTPQRFDQTVLPDGAVVNSIAYHKQGATIELTSPQPFTARYLTFDFPGWTAVIDNNPVPITPSSPEGLITFPVPAGEHTIDIRWQSTPLRTILVAFSLLSVAATVGTAVVLSRQPSAVSRQPSTVSRQPKKPTTDHRPPTTDHRLLFLLTLSLIAFKFLIVDKIDTPLRRFSSPPVENTVVLQGGELRLDGFNLSAPVVESGGTFVIDMAWTAVSPPLVDYQTNIQLVGPDGLTWSDLNTFRPRLYEDAAQTRFWLPGQWGWDSREVTVLSGSPPGEYDLVITLFDRDSLQPVTLTDAAGAVVGPTAVIGKITVTLPQEQPEFGPENKVETAVPDTGLRLLGFNQDRDAARPGDIVFITLFWERVNAEPVDTFILHLLDEQAKSVNTWNLSLTRDDWGPNVGERLRGQYLLRLPAGVESGSYQFLLQDEITLGTVSVTAPDRVFAQPGMETAVSIPFFSQETPIATLTGYTISNLQSPLSLTLTWQANQKTNTSYRVFIHLIDANDTIIAQSDGEPAAWTRPTTGWVPGEYITDTHTLPVPTPLADGPFTLRIGLYNPATGTRLLTGDGDAVEIAVSRSP